MTLEPQYRCVECSHPVSSLFTAYSRDNVRLTQCSNCKKFADKYVEHDFIVLLIDIILIKPQVYRHLLFNSLAYKDGRYLHPSIFRLAVLLVLFDVYLTWIRVEKYFDGTGEKGLRNLPLLLQYMTYFCLCCAQSATLHLTIRACAAWTKGFTSGNSVSTALLISSSTKLLPILMVIWQYDVPAAARAVGWSVIVNNIEALTILLECSYITAGVIAIVGATARATVGFAFLLLIRQLSHHTTTTTHLSGWASFSIMSELLGVS